MIFVRTFKGYEDKTGQLDEMVNEWIAKNQVDVVSVKTVLSHEPESRAGSGDLLYTVLYKAEKAVEE